MKKTYINPKVTIVKIHTASMIASSPASPEFSDNGGSAGLNEGTASGSALSRGSGLWDDDEE